MYRDSLFTQQVLDSLIRVSRLEVEAADRDIANILNHKLCEVLSFTGDYQMPVVEAIKCPPPARIAAFYRLHTDKEINDYVPHFYTQDSHIESLWRNPYKWLAKLLRARAVISPDLSVYNELVLSQKIWNIFRNKLLASWWQHNGVRVIPNISWPQGLNYDISFDGWPQNSVVAVNSTGIGRDERCRRMWLDGYEELLSRLHPTHILRYGVKIEGEREDISTYYPNDNQVFARHGR